REYSNGGTTVNGTLSLAAGTLGPGEVFVVCNVNATNPTLVAACNQSSGNLAMGFNGNDALELVHTVGSTSTVVDSIGQVGVNPGAAWTNGSVSTAGDLQRKCGT